MEPNQFLSKTTLLIYYQKSIQPNSNISKMDGA